MVCRQYLTTNSWEDDPWKRANKRYLENIMPWVNGDSTASTSTSASLATLPKSSINTLSDSITSSTNLTWDNKNKTFNQEKENVMNKKVYHVCFKGSKTVYDFYSDIPLEKNFWYDVEADGTTYSNPIKVVAIDNKAKQNVYIKTIRKAKKLNGIKRPNDGIKKVIFNEKKRTTVVIWKDDVKTIVKCHELDTFDREKALAMCYMKRYFDNRGCFNEVLRKYCREEEEE